MSLRPDSIEAENFADAVERAAADFDELVGTAMIAEPPADLLTVHCAEAHHRWSFRAPGNRLRRHVTHRDRRAPLYGKTKQSAGKVLRAASRNDDR